MKLVLLAAALAFSTCVLARPNFQAFGQCASIMKVSEFQLALLRNARWQDMLSEMYDCEDKAIADALRSERASPVSHPDLVEAIKTAYIKDKAYIGSLTKSKFAQDIAQREKSEAWDRAALEWRIAYPDK